MNIKILFASLIIGLTVSSCKKTDDTVVTTDSPAVTTNTFNIELAYKTTVNANPKCFLDLDKGIAYNVQEAPAHAAEIDLVWLCYSSNQLYLYKPSANIFSIINDGFSIGTLGFGNWSVRNNGLLEYSTSLSKGQVANIKTVADLTTFIKDDLPIQEQIEFNGDSDTFAKVYIFETGQKKRGVLIANSNSYDSNGGRANITVKIQP
jgi:hypothetical protein